VTARRVELRQLAAADISDAADHYLGEGGEPLALRFIDAIEHAVGRIGRSPHIGSLRFSYELEIPDLRAWPLDRFPHLVFYVAADDRIDVWRVLHSRRDIPSALTDDVE
jgi:toxin ParE1/3/4